MAVDLDQPVRLWPLTSLDQGDSVTVGRPDIDVYISLPPDGAALLGRLRDGDSPATAATWYAREFGDPVDIEAFVAALADVDFVMPQTSGTTQPERATTPRPLRGQRLGAALFSPAAWLAYAGIAATGAWVLLTEPTLRPGPNQLHFGGSITLTYLLITVGLIPFLLAHEGFHSLAGRRLGLRSSTSVSHRFVFVVIETRLDGLVSLPRRAPTAPTERRSGRDERRHLWWASRLPGCVAD